MSGEGGELYVPPTHKTSGLGLRSDCMSQQGNRKVRYRTPVFVKVQLRGRHINKILINQTTYGQEFNGLYTPIREWRNKFVGGQRFAQEFKKYFLLMNTARVISV